MNKYYVDKKSLNFLRVVAFVIIICIIIAIKYLMYYIERRYPEYYLTTKPTVPEIIVWVIIAALITAYVVFLFIILPMWYNSVCYMVSSEEIVIRSGVIFNNTTYVKTDSVQYTATVKCPLSKHTSFNFLLINAYGGKLIMMFLSSFELEEINKKIQSGMKGGGEI